MHRLLLVLFFSLFLVVGCRDACDDVVCENDGVCVDGTCECDSRYEGSDCTTDKCSNGVQDSGEDGVDCGGFCDNDCYGTTAVELFNTANTNLPDNNITDLVTANDGSIWIGTQQGLVHYSNEIWTVYTTANSSLPDNDIRDLYLADNGAIWVGTWGGKAAKITGTNIEVFTGYPSSTTGTFAYFDEDSQGNIYVIDNLDRILKYDGSAWSKIDTANSAYYVQSFRGLAIDANDVIWTGTTENGLMEYDGSTVTNYNTGNSALQDNNVWSVVVAAGGTKYLGSENGMVEIDNSGNWQVFTQSNSDLMFNSTALLYLDNSGKLWTDAAYIEYYNGTAFKHVDYYGIDWGTVTPFNFFAEAVTQDSEGYYWLGTYSDGILRFKLK